MHKLIKLLLLPLTLTGIRLTTTFFVGFLLVVSPLILTTDVAFGESDSSLRLEAVTSLDETLNHTSEVVDEANNALNTTEKAINDLNERIAEQKEHLKTTYSEETKIVVQEHLNYLEKQISEEKRTFERLALGGVNPDQFQLTSEESVVEDYNWHQELLVIIQPVFAEIQRMTSSIREKDYLTRQLSETSHKLSELNKGLENLQTLDRGELNDATLLRLTNLEEYWLGYQKDLKRQQDSYSATLKELTDDRAFFELFIEALKNFVTGRGLVIFTSFIVFFGVLYLLTKTIDFIVFFREKRRSPLILKASIKWRILLLILRIASILAAMVAGLVVLHAMGDMVLFGLAILLLTIILFGFRNYLPRYLSELRFFLNLGSVRQGERVLYRGIPWRVERIYFYGAYLVNPALDNGRIRLLYPSLMTLTSRPVEMDEVWFPSRVGDRFLLSDETFVEVLRQTPEFIYLKSWGRFILYPTDEFFAAKLVNLSDGFYSVVEFSLDYKHFDLPIDYVIRTLERGITDFLKMTDLHDQYETLSVDFSEISQDYAFVYKVFVFMKGSAADFYYTISRKVEQACLRVAQKEGWTLAYNHVALETRRSHPFRPIKNESTDNEPIENKEENLSINDPTSINKPHKE